MGLTSLLEFYLFLIVAKSVNNFASTNSIYKDKNNNQLKNKSVKAFCNMHLQYYVDNKKIMPPFCGSGSTASRLEQL